MYRKLTSVHGFSVITVSDCSRNLYESMCRHFIDNLDGICFFGNFLKQSLLPVKYDSYTVVWEEFLTPDIMLNLMRLLVRGDMIMNEYSAQTYKEHYGHQYKS